MRAVAWTVVFGIVASGSIACAEQAATAPQSASNPAELKAGDQAPAFEAKGDDGKTYSLASLAGKKIVLYFYPKDDTPGCTVEAQEFRDEAPLFEKAGAIVLGVSTDDAASHQAFREKHDLNFPLLVGGEPIAKAYGVPVRLGYASRQTFVIGADGRLLAVFRDVKPKGHAKEILGLL